MRRGVPIEGTRPVLLRRLLQVVREGFVPFEELPEAKQKRRQVMFKPDPTCTCSIFKRPFAVGRPCPCKRLPSIPSLADDDSPSQRDDLRAARVAYLSHGLTAACFEKCVGRILSGGRLRALAESGLPDADREAILKALGVAPPLDEQRAAFRDIRAWLYGPAACHDCKHEWKNIQGRYGPQQLCVRCATVRSRDPMFTDRQRREQYKRYPNSRRTA